jgi:hypothetical protein
MLGTLPSAPCLKPRRDKEALGVVAINFTASTDTQKVKKMVINAIIRKRKKERKITLCAWGQDGMIGNHDRLSIFFLPMASRYIPI